MIELKMSVAKRKMHVRFCTLVLYVLCVAGVMGVMGVVGTTSDAVGAESLEYKVNEIIRKVDLGQGGLFHFVFRDVATGSTLVSANGDTPMTPASNMKLVTTATALAMLGQDYEFATRLRVSGKTLIIHGDGDPGFGDPRMLKTVGITVDELISHWVKAAQQVSGGVIDEIIVDDRIFDRQFVHPKWPTNQLHRWYCAQVAAINFNDNCVDLHASVGRVGQKPYITLEPTDAAVLMDDNSVTGKGKEFWAARNIGTNKIVIRGNLQRNLTKPLSITVDDPPIFFAETLRARLRKSGVEVGRVRRVKDEEVLPEGHLLAEVTSTLPSIILRCNRDSQNLFAEALIKRIGYELTGQPGSWGDGAAAVRMYLSRVLDAGAASRVIIDDGSGMSQDNRISPNTFVRLLSHVQNNEPFAEVYLNSFARPGGEGTLDDRFKGLSIDAQIYAKSGYINGVTTLAGYLVYPDRKVAFSMMLNKYYMGTTSVKRMMENIIDTVDEHLTQQKNLQLGG